MVRLFLSTRSSSNFPPRNLAIGVIVLCGSPSVSRVDIPRPRLYIRAMQLRSYPQDPQGVLSSLTADPDHGHRPFYDSCFHILVTVHCKTFLHRCFRHREGVSSALEMVLGQDGTADDQGDPRWIPGNNAGTWSQNQITFERIPVDLHRGVFSVEDDAVLIIVDVRGILEAPGLAV